jgi:hypothetical protein
MSAVRHQLKKEKVLRTRSEGIRLASKKGKLGSGLRGKKRVFTQDHKNNISKSRLGKGMGISWKPNGYAEITMGEHKGKLLHRLKMELQLGRELATEEIVHHIDGNKANNRIENLMIMSRADHSRHHALELNVNRNRDAIGRYK